MVDLDRLYQRIKRLAPSGTKIRLTNTAIQSNYTVSLDQFEVADLVAGTKIEARGEEFEFDAFIPTTAVSQDVRSVRASERGEEAIDALANRMAMWDKDRLTEIERLRAQLEETRKENTELQVVIAGLQADLRLAGAAAESSAVDRDVKERFAGLAERAIDEFSPLKGIARRMQKVWRGLSEDEKARFLSEWGAKFGDLVDFLQ